MQLGFVSAVLPDWNLSDILKFAGDEGFACVELMCWPTGDAEKRHAGVTHLDVSNPACGSAIGDMVKASGVAISGLGYYPNPLHPDPAHRSVVIEHLKKIITAAGLLGVRVVNTFIGRNQHQSVPANWPLVQQIWPAIVQHAEQAGVMLGIENCPMLFHLDQWPGGGNLATSPAIWRQLFETLPSKNLGLNFDPSHLVWQFIDCVRCIHEFGQRIVHVHAKDTRIDADKLYEVGNLGLGWHTAKLPGLGEVAWGQFFSALNDVGYQGPVCIEVEDRAFESSVPDRLRALRQSKRFLEQFMS